MPEGPSIVILKEAVAQFKGETIIKAIGNTKIDLPNLDGETIIDFKSWGKHFLICFKTFTIRIHFMLFGTYLINEKKDKPPRLGFQFKDGELNFYSCSIELIKEDIDKVYDWTADVMNKKWDAKKAKIKMKLQPDLLVCDALMDQKIFAGVGNIIKNEVLFRIKVHPLSKVNQLPLKKLNELLKETVIYTFQFYEWKKANELKKHWLAYNKKICPRDNVPFNKKDLGKSHRSTYYCDMCQQLYV